MTREDIDERECHATDGDLCEMNRVKAPVKPRNAIPTTPDNPADVVTPLWFTARASGDAVFFRMAIKSADGRESMLGVVVDGEQLEDVGAEVADAVAEGRRRGAKPMAAKMSASKGSKSGKGVQGAKGGKGAKGAGDGGVVIARTGETHTPTVKSEGSPGGDSGRVAIKKGEG